MVKIKMKKITESVYYIVGPSPWPLLVAISIGEFILIFVRWLNEYIDLQYLGYIPMLYLTFFIFFYSLCGWVRDLVVEALYDGLHTQAIQRNLRFGFVFFLLSEIMLFFSFFWAYFNYYINPTPEIGSIWPPIGINIIPPTGLALINTLILLLSGVTLTYAHACLVVRTKLSQKKFTATMFSTIFLGCLFTVSQLFEYFQADFAIHDSVFGSSFYFLTGCHGLHVIIGTLFLFIQSFRQIVFYHYSSFHHIGFELAIWYWHFVDVVWLFLYLTLYIMPSLIS